MERAAGNQNVLGNVEHCIKPWKIIGNSGKKLEKWQEDNWEEHMGRRVSGTSR